MPEIDATFRKPFDAQVAAWRLRLGELRPTFGAGDPNYTQHDRAFMVAGAVKADLLADLGAAVDRAVVEGTGFEAFKKDFRAIVTKNGWHGWTGEGSKRGEEWRMRTIYRTNMRTSYMAGRYAQLVDGNYKFWVYRHSGAANPRHDHLAFDGLALPPDHPFWAKHFPPNGWGCGCDVYGARSDAGIRRKGGDPSKTLPADWDAIDPHTGAPFGVGKDWDHSPDNAIADLVNVMVQKAVKWGPQSSTAFMQSAPASVRDDLSTSLRQLPSLADAVRRMFNRVSNDATKAATSREAIGLVTRKMAAGPIDRFFDIEDFGIMLDARAVQAFLDIAGPDTGLDLFEAMPRALDRATFYGSGRGNVAYLVDIAGQSLRLVFDVSVDAKTLTLAGVSRRT